MEQSKLMQDLHRGYHYIQHAYDQSDAKKKIQKAVDSFSKDDQQKLSELMQKFTDKLKEQVGDLDHKVKGCDAHFKNACPRDGGKKKVADVGDPEHKGPGYKDHNPEG